MNKYNKKFKNTLPKRFLVIQMLIMMTGLLARIWTIPYNYISRELLQSDKELKIQVMINLQYKAWTYKITLHIWITIYKNNYLVKDIRMNKCKVLAIERPLLNVDEKGVEDMVT